MTEVGFLNEDHPYRSTAGLKRFFAAVDNDRMNIISWHEFQSFFADLQKCVVNKPGSILHKESQDTVKSMMMAKDFEIQVKKLREQGQKTIRTTSADASFALRCVKAEMQKRIEETVAMQKPLEFLISETDKQIRLHAWKLTWRDHAEVREETSKVSKTKRLSQNSFAKNADPVAASVAAADELERQPDLEPLEVVEGIRDKLVADLQDKVAALNIDLRCQHARCAGDQISVEPIHPPKTGGRQFTFRQRQSRR